MIPIEPNQCLSSAQAKRLDSIAIDQLGLSGLILMENVGIRCAQIAANRFPQSHFVVLCGTGNNGGDGLVIARQLAVTGHQVTVWIAGDHSTLRQDCAANLEILIRLDLPKLDLIKADRLPESWPLTGSGKSLVIIDAMLGISARGEPREPMASAIQWANQQAAFRIAIDVPTGLDPDTGQPAENTILAQMTLTIECPKTFATHRVAKVFIGELIVVPLGIPPWVVARARGEST